MSSSDPTASSQKNESRKTIVPRTTAQASTTSPTSPDSHEGVEVFTATATQAEAFLGGGRHDAREGPLQTSSPEMVLRATLTVPKEPKTLEDAAAAGKEPTPRNASEHYATTDSIDSTHQVPGNADIPEAACYVTAQPTPHSQNPSVSEHSSTFQTAEEINAVRGPWYVMLQDKSHKPAVKQKQPRFEDTAKVVQTELFSWRSRDVTKLLPAQQTGEDANKILKQSIEEGSQPPYNSTTPTVKMPTSEQPSENAENQQANVTPDENAALNRKEKDLSTPPETEMVHHTKSHYKDWPSHRWQTIPDAASTVFLNAKMLDLKGCPPHLPDERKRTFILTKVAEMAQSHEKEQPLFWEPLYETKDATSSNVAPTEQKPSSITGRQVGEIDVPDDGAGYIATTKPGHRKCIDIKRTSSADAIDASMEAYSPLYSYNALLNFDKDQIEDPLQKTPAASHASSPPDNQDNYNAAQSTSSEGATPRNESPRPSRLIKIKETLSAIISDITVDVTPRRYWILLTFCTLSMLNAFQWIQYSIIASVIKDHYGVSDTVISWTSLLYLIGYMTLAFPSAWILDNMGLRITVLIGAVGTALGACIKTFAVKPGQFTLVLVGQAFPAFAQAFILGVPPRLSSAWFKYEELSTACSMGVLGNNLGIALGFVIPPNVVHVENVETSLLYLCGSVGLASCVCFVVILLAFDDKPKKPPSFSEMLNRSRQRRQSFSAAFITLLTDGNFWLLLLSYGLNTGAFYSISTLLNPVILAYFPGEETFAGWLGLALIVSGLVGSWLCGLMLDQTGKYKEVTLLTYILATVGLFVYTFILSARSRLLSLLGCLFLGFFMTGYIPIGLQLAAEITYPTPEGISSNLMNVSAQAIGFDHDSRVVYHPRCLRRRRF
ncbi:hypothetical protein HPB51_015342 [Rhipicephalus microplus]|uniref:Major facilitator superfamily (MFS) profile domain-containing protein n=1 Tax=Rhipicephalus microplus TaxID=6941 RepID=A0A9J6DVP8_RHIMP|nr:hypothetical protein HPB51_015342 [Rhipicephalus microplus]